MSEIIDITGSNVKIGKDDGQVVTVPIASLNFPNPKVGDEVKLYKDGDNYVVHLVGKSQAAPSGSVKTVNKHVFVWVFNFLLGWLGVDRFVRGQVGVGVCKLLFGWMTCGIWTFVDWVIAMCKAYGAAFGNDEEISFDIKGNYTK